MVYSEFFASKWSSGSVTPKEIIYWLSRRTKTCQLEVSSARNVCWPSVQLLPAATTEKPCSSVFSGDKFVCLGGLEVIERFFLVLCPLQSIVRGQVEDTENSRIWSSGTLNPINVWKPLDSCLSLALTGSLCADRYEKAVHLPVAHLGEGPGGPGRPFLILAKKNNNKIIHKSFLFQHLKKTAVPSPP